MTSLETFEAIAKLINCEITWLHPYDEHYERDSINAWFCELHYLHTDGRQRVFHMRKDDDIRWGQFHKLDVDCRVVHMPLEDAALFALKQISGNTLFLDDDTIIARFPVFSSYEELMLKLEVSGEKLLQV